MIRHRPRSRSPARWLFLAIMLAMGPFPGPGLAAAGMDGIDALIQRTLDELGIPGLSVAIVQSGKVAHVRGFGVTVEGGSPVTEDTPFVLGSTSKSFTALAIMQLCEAGKLDLDAPVVGYVPWFRVADLEASRRITIRHLLNHTSGLSTLTGRAHLDDDDRGATALERFTRELATARLRRPVGSAYEYSNANYSVLGSVIEAVTKRSFGEMIQERIFTPLGMNHSFVSMDAARRDGLATGHRLWFGYPVSAPELPWSAGSLPDGTLISSARDLARYLLAHVNGRKVRTPLLSPGGFRELHRAAVPAGGGFAYGMGWFVHTGPAWTVVLHGGDLAHFHSDLEFVPDLGLGVALLVNVNTFVMSRRLGWLAHQVLLLAAGKSAGPVAEALWSRCLYVGLVILVALQIIGLAISLRRLRRLRAETEPAVRAHGARILRVWSLLDLTIACGLLLGIPWQFEAPLRLIVVWQPDLGLGLVVVATWMVTWSLLRWYLAWNIVSNVDWLHLARADRLRAGP